VWEKIKTDYLVIGSGIAGLTLSLLASQYGKVALITKGSLANCNSRLAQGGIAASMAPEDHCTYHAEDTIKTGQGLCVPTTVRTVVKGAKEAILFLEELGISLDRHQDGTLELGKEGAHGFHRIVHAGGDATGAVIMQELTRRIQAEESIQIWENTMILDLVIENGECTGAMAKQAEGKPLLFDAKAVVLATGGLGQLYKFTTNDLSITGDGYSLAYRAGAVLRDMEFVQFHPTAFNVDVCPLPLISEAVRGEGALLVTGEGETFMKKYDPRAELASRDIVSRAIYFEMQAGKQVYLDARMISPFAQRFPTIYASCQNAGINPEKELIPVVPAVHYAMGGVKTSEQGITSIPRLFAVGEVASSGLHGANRLASNSLLEGLTLAKECIQKLIRVPLKQRETIAPPFTDQDLVKINTKLDPAFQLQVQDLMWSHVGIIREERQLKEALEQIEVQLQHRSHLPSAETHLLTTALLVVRAALWRKESRGAHYRNDFPNLSKEYANHSLQGGRYEFATYSAIPQTSAY
jgi:L-aspartate oxidase